MQGEAAVAATEQENPVAAVGQMQLVGHAILAAALSMPFLEVANAETVPESTVVSYKYLDYRESQPDLDRIKVKAQAVSLLMPFAGDWSVQASYTKDIVSGASPRFWTKGAASMRDNREAKDISVTRYFPHDTVTLGASVSEENDYLSQGVSLSGTHSTEDKNTTFNYGFAVTNDDITSLGLNESKRRVDWALGVTQILTQRDIVQFTVTDSQGRGYFSDPYKLMDARPDSRHQNTAMLRWNHFIAGPDATLRLSYRYYTDSWSVQAHTLGVEYVQPLADGWVLTPSLRLHDQSAAKFYVDQADFPGSGNYVSFDQRLSAFGARTYGMKIAKTFASNWTVDLKYERYLQRTDWRLFGAGSPDLDSFTANMFQIGVSYRF